MDYSYIELPENMEEAVNLIIRLKDTVPTNTKEIFGVDTNYIFRISTKYPTVPLEIRKRLYMMSGLIGINQVHLLGTYIPYQELRKRFQVVGHYIKIIN